MSLRRKVFLGSEPIIGKGRCAAGRQDGPPDHARGDDQDGHRRPRPRPARGNLSGGERQAVSIARAGYLGAEVLVLDEPTSALGVKQSGVVLKYIVQARGRLDLRWRSGTS